MFEISTTLNRKTVISRKQNNARAEQIKLFAILENGPANRAMANIQRNFKRPRNPYRTLSAWTWRRIGDKEEIKIEAGPDLITLTGRGLVRLRQALDEGTLELVVERVSTGSAAFESAVVVESLAVEKSN